MEGTLEIPALGRRMCLGTLYDCRSHQVISPGATLWDEETISRQRQVSDEKSHGVSLVKSHSFDSKSKALGIDESLKASLLADLVQTKGSAKFLVDPTPPLGTDRLSVHSKATSLTETLPLGQQGSCKLQNSEAFTAGKATHVVVGVVYGSDTFFVFDKSGREETKDEGLKSLIPLVGHFCSVRVPDEGGSSTFDPEEAKDVECKVYSDLEIEGCHVDYKAASKLLTSIPDLLDKGAVPVKFYLFPLHKIDSRAARVCRVMSNDLLSQVQGFLEGLEQCSARAGAMAADPLCVDFPQFTDKFAFFQRMLSEYTTDFQREFARILPLVLGGSDGESALKEMLQIAASSSPFNLAELDAWLKSKRKEFSFVSLYMKFLPDDIQVVKSQESLDDILMDPGIDNVVCLTFRLTGREEGYLRSLSQFLAKRKESNYSFHQCCDDGSVRKSLRTKAKLFANFFLSNRQSECTVFIVTGFDVGLSVGEEAKVGGTVLLFEQDVLVEVDYEPPSQPGKPQCDVIDHNTANVSWSPPQYGRDGVQRYIIKVKRFRGKNLADAILDEVHTEKGDTRFTFTNLEPDETLEFWITAVCSVGVSPDSESSGRVKTLPASQPGKPQVRPASTSSIALEWEHPAQSGKQLAIRSYAVVYEKVVGGAVSTWQGDVNTGSPEGRFTVPKLEVNESYVFQVAAIYDSGVSLFSLKSEVCATLPVSQPGKPEVSEVTASSVDMAWTGPAKTGPGVKLKEYFVEVDQVADPQSPKWSQVLTNSLDERHKLSDLLPGTAYVVRVVLVCENDYMTASEPSASFTTLAVGSPTDVTVKQTSASDMEVSWSKPTSIGQHKTIQHYRVGYRVVAASNPGEKKKIETNDDICTATISDAIPETEFKIWVTAVCGVAEDGESSKVISFTTRNLLKHEIRVTAKVLADGNEKNGKPCILKFPLDEMCRELAGQSFSFGEPPKMPGVDHKVIMIVGVTGSGKSTLINAMANHILGVDRKDDFRFKIVDVDEARGSSQAHSQTQILTSYTIYRSNYLSLPYTLSVIDTPGFGDTRGVERDKEIMNNIREFFLDSESHGIDHIDGIGFVVPASQARLTQTQKYVFDSILSVFGKDIADNIRLLVTFADQSEPPVLDAVKTAEIPYTGAAFKFNNSALFSGHTKYKKLSRKKSDKKENGDMVDLFWDMGRKNMADFLLEIQKLDSKSLVLTKEVLEERKRLEVTVQGLQPQINVGICKLEELQQEIRLLQQHEIEIEANKDFTFELEVPKSEMVKISDGTFITNCSKCHFTCHYPCAIADDKKKSDCAAMANGVCTACPQKCAWDVHFNQPYKFVFYTEKERRTYEEIEARYKDASGKKMTVEQVIKKQVEGVEEVRACVYKLVSDMRKSIMRLEEIALKPNPLSTPEYVDVLIESEKRSHKPGWQGRVDVLRGIRDEAEIMDKVMDESYDPFQKYKTVLQPQADSHNKPNMLSWFKNLWSSVSS